MDIRHLRSFVTVAENLHFSRSAEQLGLSPPTLTAQIQEVERLLQARLFNRTKRSVSLTPAGEAFLTEARATLDQLDRAIHVGRRAGRGQVGRVEIGYVGSAAFFGVLQDQVQRFRNQWPDVMVNTKEFPTDQLTPLLEEGRIGAQVGEQVAVEVAAAEDADASGQALDVVARMLHRLPAQFEEDPLLRIGQLGITRQIAEEGVVERFDAVDQAPCADVAGRIETRP